MKKLTIFLAIVIALVSLFVILRKGRPPKEEYPKELEVIEIKKTALIIDRAPKIAIVLDDFGYNLNNIDAIFELNTPVTFSILPNLYYSTKISEAAHGKDYEFILHLPLEPHEENKPLEKDTIFTAMEETDVIKLLEKAMASIPGLKGASNHMGSRATADERLMSIIFKRMKKDRLFFMDNIVTIDTVCKKVARKQGIKFIHRSVFLDNEADIDYIKGQINELKIQAAKTGWGVGVGHDRPKTVEALKEMIPEMKKEGINFVFLSELAR